MNSNSNSRKKTSFREAIDVDDDEVNQLLRAAQDDLLLKLSLNSHIAKATSSQSSPSHLDPDLDSRFEALKSKSNLSASTGRVTIEVKTPEKNLKKKYIESDDLFARFAALKGSSSSAPSSHSNEMIKYQQSVLNEEEDNEVEQLIKWAIDAARLDPSPPPDSDNDEGRDDDDEDDDDDDDDDPGKRK